MSATPPTVRPPGALPYSDPRGCKEWLNALPLTNIPQAQSLVLESLRALGAAAGIDAMARLKCLELYREKVAFLQGEQRGRYFGKTLPLSANDAAAWATGRTLLEEMERGYRRVLEEGGPGAGEIEPHRTLATQRIVRYMGAQMLFHAIVYRRFDPGLWRRLHAEYLAAERSGTAAEPVKDSMESDDGQSHVAEAYARVVLLQAAYLSELTAPQMDFVEALLRAWARRVPLRKPEAAPAGGSHPLAVDLERDIGARPLVHAEAKPSHRVLDTEQVSKSLRKRIHALKNEEDYAGLGLPPLGSPTEALALLVRLHRLWCEGAPPRPPAKVPAEKKVGLVLGWPEIGFFVSGGAVFEQPDRKRELTRQEKQDIEVFGRITERTQSMMLSEHNFTVEAWGVVDEMMGAWRVVRPGTAAKGVAIGRLAAVRLGDAGAFFLGMVSALSHETDGRIVATVTLFPGRPESVPVRAADARNRANAQWSQAFRLPALERLNVAASFVVPAGIAARGRGIELWEAAPVERTVYEILERGTDFDRITVF